MTQAPASFTRRDPGITARIVADRRRHKRVHVTLHGRYMRADKQEYPCKLYDISLGGAAILSPGEVEMGERIVAYFEQIGRVEGAVCRVFEGGFAILLQASLHKREKLCAQLTWLVNKAELAGIEDRRHERVAVKDAITDLKLEDGTLLQVTVADVSISGASIVTDARPPIGQAVTLGKLRARVARHHDKGIALEFIDIQNPAALKRTFG